jgi:hypothetical protein
LIAQEFALISGESLHIKNLCKMGGISQGGNCGPQFSTISAISVIFPQFPPIFGGYRNLNHGNI